MQPDWNEVLHEEDLYCTNEAPRNDNIDTYENFKIKINFRIKTLLEYISVLLHNTHTVQSEGEGEGVCIV
jgi:hypothetical protein